MGLSGVDVWIGDDGRRWVSEADHQAEVERLRESLIAQFEGTGVIPLTNVRAIIASHEAGR